jgi:hypothetical protein
MRLSPDVRESDVALATVSEVNDLLEVREPACPQPFIRTGGQHLVFAFGRKPDRF